MIFEYIFFTGLGPPILGRARPGPKKKNWAHQLQGWTQPTRVGWADVPLKRTKGWLLVTVLS